MNFVAAAVLPVLGNAFLETVPKLTFKASEPAANSHALSIISPVKSIVPSAANALLVTKIVAAAINVASKFFLRLIFINKTKLIKKYLINSVCEYYLIVFYNKQVLVIAV